MKTSNAALPSEPGRGAKTRARNLDEGKTRTFLLEAASLAMIRHGTHDVSLQMIARTAKLTAPLITYHFGSKEGLLLALTRRDAAAATVQLDHLLGMTLAPDKKLKIHISGIIKTFARRPYLNGLLEEMIRDANSESAKIISREFISPLADAQRQIIEEGIREGYFREIDPKLAYFMIVGACHQLFSREGMRRVVLDSAEIEPFISDYSNLCAETFVSGLRR